MSVSIPAFWKLLGQSRLLAPEQCQQLYADFNQMKGAPTEGSARPLAEWLVSRNVLSRYQTAILLAGRSGPFFYGDYKVYDRISKGRLAGLFRAVHAPTGHPVLLQFLTGPIIQDPQLWAAAANEALAATNIVSPFVARIYEPVDLQTFKFLVLEDMRGGSLDECLQQGRFPPAEACRLVRLAALGLAQMHQAGRIHGDIRPSNLLLETSAPNHPGNLKLLFEPHIAPGPINFADQDPAGRLAQSADYLAPELMQPGRAPDPLSDVYALGCTLYCLLTGNPPFAGGNVQQKMQRHATEPIRPLEAFGIGPPLAQLVPYLMAKNPAVRLQSAAIVAEQLAPLVDPALANSYPPPPPPTLPNYENWLRQKRQHLQAQAAAVNVAPVAPQPAINLNLGAAAEPAFPAVGVSVGSGGAKTGSAAAEIYARRKKQKQRNLLIGGLGSLAALIVLGIVALNFFGDSGKTEIVAENNPEVSQDDDVPPLDAGPTTPTITPTTNTTSAPPGIETTTTGAPAMGDPATGSAPGSGSAVVRQEIVPDDGELLWASPTTGQPPSFRLVPLDGQVFISVRPSEILASPDGEKVITALGPDFAAQREAFEKASGFKLSEIKHALVTLHPNDAQFPRVSVVVTPNEKLSPEQLVARWGNPAAAKEGEATYYTGPNWAFYAPADSEDGTFLMSDVENVKEVAATKRSSPPLMLHMERLRKSMDGDRHFSLLFRPSFLFNDDGEPLFAGERQKVKEPLRWFLGDGVEAGLVSMHFGNEFYIEGRSLGSLSKDKYQLAKEMRERLKEIPDLLTDYFVALTPPPYWKKLSFRYPQMVSALHDNMRVGVESEHAVINAVLPGVAAHNLVLGGELLLASAPGAAVAAGPAAPAATGPKTIEELLKLKSTLTFDAMAFDTVMAQIQADGQELAKGTPLGKGGAQEFTIKILGNDDLRPEGITQQQTVRDFKQENKTLAEILTAMVMRANPVTTVKEPTEVDQKLIWVIGPDPDNPSKQVVLITTRSAAARKKYKLPDVFVPKE